MQLQLTRYRFVKITQNKVASISEASTTDDDQWKLNLNITI